MKLLLYRYTALAVALALVAYGLPRRATAKTLPRGERTAAQAVRKTSGTPPPVQTIALPFATPSPGASTPELPVHANYLHFSALELGSAQPDTTSEFEFPEEDNKHLVRDITVFVIVSAFVAFFLIKVFLEDDPPEQPDDDGGGKVIPPVSG